MTERVVLQKLEDSPLPQCAYVCFTNLKEGFTLQNQKFYSTYAMCGFHYFQFLRFFYSPF